MMGKGMKGKDKSLSQAIEDIRTVTVWLFIPAMIALLISLYMVPVIETYFGAAIESLVRTFGL